MWGPSSPAHGTGTTMWPGQVWLQRGPMTQDTQDPRVSLKGCAHRKRVPQNSANPGLGLPLLSQGVFSLARQGQVVAGLRAGT